jgi:hypothetical protein
MIQPLAPEGIVEAAPPSSRSVSEEFRARLEAEDVLVAQRASWLILSQSFLFIAYTGALVARPTHAHVTQITQLLHVFPLLGLVIVGAVYSSIWAALLTSRALRRGFEALDPERASPLDAIPGTALRRLGNLAAHVPPLAIGTTWVYLLATNWL